MRLRFLLFSFLAALPFCWLKPVDPDLGWHLLGGAWIVEHGTVPSYDFVNAFNPFWHDYHWLGQIVMFLLFKLGGYQALAIGIAVVVFVTYWVISDIILTSCRGRYGEWIAWILFVSFVLAYSTVVQMRPQILALCLVAVALRRLLQTPTRLELPGLMLLTVILVNIHVYWVLVPFLWVALRILPRAYRKRTVSSIYAWLGLAILVSAGFISPYGFFSGEFTLPSVLRNYALIYDYMNIPATLRRTVGEFRSTIEVSTIGFWSMIVALPIVAYGFRLKRALISHGVLFLITFALALKAAKYFPLYAMCSIPFLAYGFRQVFRGCDNLFGAYLFRWKHASFAAQLVLLAAIEAALLQQKIGIQMRALPTAACTRIAEIRPLKKADRQQLRILTHFDYGGWCRWAIYQKDSSLDYRVTTDNRTQGVPEEHLRRSLDLFNFRYDWAQTLRAWDPDVAVVKMDLPLASFMWLAKSDWKLLFQDEAFAVFLKKGAES